MLAGMNCPIRMGAATCMPGDIVLAKREGVVFVPPHLVEGLVTSSEQTQLRDVFGKSRMRDGTYTPGMIDQAWSADIDADFDEWLEANAADKALAGVPEDSVWAFAAQRKAGEQGAADVSTVRPSGAAGRTARL